ncbi:O-antigen ligase [Vibrio tubiashii]|uniref:Exopolysaccharide biosynthesis protein n=1 Tax=Vibrio tubiashii ATCC 19109 TaxID=1051646 RepID=F9TC69_9VIBR|nr:O-antigen ligase family protein [Vibrio tubiashii]AIW16169.1 exopolysaccharide biosynthesis protein [Vibrio tubiashii ATCC 19109]EGU48122.1 exopolysaccharide production protein [Vibrio tubiashii ATCC 19109]EIF03494.1 exopolysaccharide production protein [Vibrio tubiashii NCIMB 1337 = ATCC 19106]
MIIRISNNLLLTLYAVLIIFTVSTFRNRGVESSGFDLQLIIKALVWLMCGAVSLFFMLRVNIRPSSWTQALILVYAIFILMQSPLSPAGSYSIMASVVFMIFVVANLVIFNLFDHSRAIEVFLKASLVLCFMSLVFYFLFPSIALQEYWNDLGYIEGVRFKGIASNANAIGQVASISLFLLIVSSTHTEMTLSRLVVMLGVLSVLVLSQSRTSMLALVVATSYFLLHKRYAYILYVLVAGFTIGAIVWVSELYMHVLPSLSRSGGVEELFTFTGRTLIWEVVVDLISDKPWTGYGYASSKTLIPLNFETSWGWTTVNSHQFILQLLLSTGFIGSIPILLILLTQLYFLITFKAKLSSSLFIFVLITGILESGAIGPIPNYLTLVWLITISVLFKEFKLERLPNETSNTNS